MGSPARSRFCRFWAGQQPNLRRKLNVNPTPQAVNPTIVLSYSTYEDLLLVCQTDHVIPFLPATPRGSRSHATASVAQSHRLVCSHPHRLIYSKTKNGHPDRRRCFLRAERRARG